MDQPIPTKPAFHIRPGETLMEEDPKMVTGVSWHPVRDEVFVRVGDTVRTYCMEDRVPYLPRDD